ncbi:MAG: DinB family protein [Gemmatimonas sp.]
MTEQIIQSQTNDDAPLNARLAELVDYATAVRAELEAWVRTVPESLHAKRAAADQWSVVEHLEHLALIEDGIGRLISSMGKQLRADNVVETQSGSLMSSLDAYGVPEVKSRLQAPQPYHPTGTLSAQEALERMRAIRTRLLDGVRKANGYDLSQKSAPHPFFGPLNGYEWLLLIGQHEKRHLNHMKAVVGSLNHPPA